MSNITKFFFILMFFCMQSVQIFGQSITVREIKELSSDFTASKYGRKDAQGKNCAAIKIALPSITNVSFKGSVGDVKNNAGEYLVYVSPGTTTLTLLKGDVSACVINFVQAGINIQPKHTYQVILNVEQTRDMVFHVTPASATVIVNGEKLFLDNDGVGKITCKPDQMYNYTITAIDYETIEDAFMVGADEEDIEPINVSLERKKGQVVFNNNIKEFELFINNEYFGEVKSGNQIEIPVGTCNIRIVAEEYEDWFKTIQVVENLSTVEVRMEKSNDVSNKLRSRSSLFLGGGLAFDFNSSTEMGKDNLRGYPIRIGVDYEKFIKRWFTFRPALEFNYFCGPKMEIDCESPFLVDMPFIFSFNAPLGKLNRNHFSIGAGPMLGYAGLFDEDSEDESNSRAVEEDDTNNSNSDFMAGVRMEARLTVNQFVLGFNIDYQYYVKQVIAKNGLLVPMITVGYKFK